MQGADIDAVSAKLTASGRTKILKTFKSDVFSGISVETGDDNVDTLQGINEVKQAWQMARIKLLKTIHSASYSDDAAAANYSVHAFTGVEKAHTAGILGKGVVIGIVDTGVDYLHPAVSLAI